MDPGHTDNLLAVLRDGQASPQARNHAALELARAQDARVVPAVLEVMRACVPGVWRSAVFSLAMQGWEAPPGLDRLLRALCRHAWNEIGPAESDAVSSLPPALVENLIQEDPGGAAKVVDTLAQHGWKPRTPGESAVSHIVRAEWDKLAGQGEACLNPLVELAWNDSGYFDDPTRAAAARTLEQVVRVICTNLPERELRYLMGLPDPVRVEEQVGAESKTYLYTWAAMRACIEHELMRRGLWRAATVGCPPSSSRSG